MAKRKATRGGGKRRARDRIPIRFQIPVREDADKARRRTPRGRKPRASSRRATRGALQPAFRWKALQNALVERFGGFTRPLGEVVGAWFDPEQGVVVHDRSRVFEVDVPEEEVEELLTLLRRACLTFVQKCIRVVVDGRVRYVSEEDDDEPL